MAFNLQVGYRNERGTGWGLEPSPLHILIAMFILMSYNIISKRLKLEADAVLDKKDYEMVIVMVTYS